MKWRGTRQRLAANRPGLALALAPELPPNSPIPPVPAPDQSLTRFRSPPRRRRAAAGSRLALLPGMSIGGALVLGVALLAGQLGSKTSTAVTPLLPRATGGIEHIEGALRTRARLTDREVRSLARSIDRAAAENGVDPDLVLAVIHTESRFAARGESRAGALGLMQIMPETGEAFAERASVRWLGPKTLADPRQNVRIGIAYLAYLLARFHGDRRVALAAYCHGPTRVARELASGGVARHRYAYASEVLMVEQEFRDYGAVFSSGS